MKKRAKGYGARGGAFADVYWALDSVLGMEPGGTDSACVLLLYSEPPPPPQALFPPPWVLSFLSPAKDQQVTDVFTTYTLESWPDTFNYIL